ncbi:MAG: hypothetical protein KDI44_14785 [Thiothrix sp.]|nr:hypothetical protein [Thiothrix sp.]HPQ94062.1 hypothetical protein [Thiolinea sp.]
MLISRAGLVVTLMLAGNITVADEIWDSNSGRIVYEAEMGPTAVWTYGTPQEPGVIYLLGLAKVYENRGSYTGYWAKNNAREKCDTVRPGIQGQMTPYWGRFNVTFLDKNFPSHWEATWSYCDREDQPLKIKAKPVLGTPPQGSSTSPQGH